jgi:lipopolysaccharide biosynthesis glycosyltransferase
MKLAFIYLTDAGGLDLLRHSAVSLAMSQHRPCDIHIFCHRFRPAPSDRLHGALASLGATLTLHDIADAGLEQHQTCGHVTKPVLLRPGAVDRLAGDYDRIVYLDNDMLVFDDLGIEALEFGRLPVAAVIDMDLSAKGPIARSGRRAAEVGAGGAPDYFNAGFMVFETRNWRGADVQARYAAELRRHDTGCDYKIDCTSLDQCALNIVFAGAWLALPPSCNMQATAKFTRHWQTARLRHYCGVRKFVPVTAFRNDGRDIAFLNRIRPLLGLPRIRFGFVHDLLYRLNVARKYRTEGELRRFLRAAEARGERTGGAIAGPATGPIGRPVAAPRPVSEANRRPAGPTGAPTGAEVLHSGL